MAVIGELATLITAKVAPFTKGLNEASAKAKSFSSGLTGTLGGALRGVGSMLTSTAGKITALAGAFGAGGFIAKSIKLASEAEDMETSYKVYLKSLEKAKGLLAEITKFSDVTPFTPTEIKEAGKQLLAFGFTAEQIMPTVKVLGDIAAGSQKPIADFVDILGKVKASGIASMGDINRLADRGVPVFQELAKVMGVSTSEVRELVGSAKVGFEDVWEVLNRVVKEGGLFNDAMVELSKTSAGKLSTIKGQLETMMAAVGKALLEGLDIKSLQDQIIELIGKYKQNVIDATKDGVALIRSALDVAPEWATRIMQFYQSMKYGGNRIAQLGQRLNPIGSAVIDFTTTGQFNPSGISTRRGELADQAQRQYNRLGMQARDQAAQRRYDADVRAMQQRNQNQPQQQQQQTKTLLDIYRENARTNDLLSRQQTQVVPRF